MSYAMVNNDVFNVTYFWQEGVQSGLMTCGFKVVAVFSAGVTADDIATFLVGSQQSGAIQSLQATTVQARGVQVDVLDLPTGRVREQGADHSVAAGTDTSVSVPGAMAMLIHKNTFNFGRKHRGRAYMPFLASDNLVTGGKWSNASVAAMNTLLNGATGLMGNSIITVGAASLQIDPQLIHRKVLPWTSESISDVVAINTPASQHRRGAFGRPNAPF